MFTDTTNRLLNNFAFSVSDLEDTEFVIYLLQYCKTSVGIIYWIYFVNWVKSVFHYYGHLEDDLEMFHEVMEIMTL